MQKSNLLLSKDILIISHKWSNRETQSPVESLCGAIDPEFKNYNGSRVNIHLRIGQIIKRWSNSLASTKYTAPYTTYSAGQELWGLIQLLKRRRKIVFYPYGDYNFNFLWLFKRLFRFKIVIYSFFSEEELSKRYKTLSHFEKVDLIFVAGLAQMEFLKAGLKTPRIVYLPLPIDTNFFTPGTTFSPFKIVQSGKNRRDFATLFYALDELILQYPMMTVDFIGCAEYESQFGSRSYVKFHGYLSDQEMLTIYQKAHLQVLIATDGGSSNSLNEGLSCGLPIVATKLNNLQDYLNEKCAILVEKEDVIGLKKAIQTIFETPMLRANMAKAAREQAIAFSLPEVLEKFTFHVNKLTNDNH